MFLGARAVNPKRFIFRRASIAIKIGISHRHFLRGVQRSRLNRIIRSGLETRVCLMNMRARQAARKSRVSIVRHCVEFSKDSILDTKGAHLAVAIGLISLGTRSRNSRACVRGSVMHVKTHARTHARTHERHGRI